MADSSHEVTRLLRAVESGEPDAEQRLYELVYAELRRMAGGGVAREGKAEFVPTSLVHDAYLRLAGKAGSFENRAHFFGAAAEAMRRILVERARARLAAKRGGGAEQVSLHDDAAADESDPAELLDVDRALERLEALDTTMADVVKLRFYVGLTVPETAEILGQSPRSVNRLWKAARTWLLKEMATDGGEA